MAFRLLVLANEACYRSVIDVILIFITFPRYVTDKHFDIRLQLWLFWAVLKMAVVVDHACRLNAAHSGHDAPHAHAPPACDRHATWEWLHHELHMTIN